MSEFSNAFALSFDSAASVFGDLCTIANNQYPCVIHSLGLNASVKSGAAGRGQEVTGAVVMLKADWIAARAVLDRQNRKGAQIILPGGTFRVLNDPLASYTSGTVRLDIGPLA